MENLPATQFDIFNQAQFEVMQRVCSMYSSSELVPDIYKVTDKNPKEKAIANCMVALEMSQRIGASALMVMQNMDIIYGRPSWRSKFLIATVNTCGRFNPLQYKFTTKGKLGKISYTEYEKTWVDGKNGAKGYYKNTPKVTELDGTNIDNIECIAYTCAKGSDQVLESSPVSIELAVKEGWYTKAGSKWQTIPQQMLIYRAASFWTSAYAPELSMGMRTTDEMEDIGEIIDAKFEDITNKVQADIKENANKGEPISFDKKTPEPKKEKEAEKVPDNKPENDKFKLLELGYTEEDIKSMQPADRMKIVMGNIKKENKAGF